MASKFKRVGKDGLTYWYVQGYDREGARYSNALGPVSEESAEAARLAAEREVEARDQRPESVTAAKALERFIESRDVSRRTEATKEYYTQKLTPVFVALGVRPLKSWRPVDLETFLATKAESWTANNVRKTIGACRTFVRWAANRGLVVPDFCRGVQPPDPDPYEAKAYTPDEVARIMDAASGSPLLLPIALAVYAGLRRADVLGLTWDEVDMDAGLIRRRAQKTKSGRPLPIIAPLAAVLKAARATHGPVCRGLPKDLRSLDRALHRVLRRAGIESGEEGEESAGGWHRFRHTCATVMLQAGVDIATVGAMLQHKPGSPMTLRYVHANKDAMKSAASVLEKAYRAKTS